MLSCYRKRNLWSGLPTDLFEVLRVPVVAARAKRATER